TDFEKINVAVLDELAVLPQPASTIQNKHNLDARDMDILRDLGRGAAYLGAYTSRTNGQEIWYSPLHWDEHPKALSDLTQKHADAEIFKAIRTVRDHQGMPVAVSEGGVLADALVLGCLPTAAVTSLAGRRDFIFAPMAGLE